MENSIANTEGYENSYRDSAWVVLNITHSRDFPTIGPDGNGAVPGVVYRHRFSIPRDRARRGSDRVRDPRSSSGCIPAERRVSSCQFRLRLLRPAMV